MKDKDYKKVKEGFMDIVNYAVMRREVAFCNGDGQTAKEMGHLVDIANDAFYKFREMVYKEEQ